MLTEYKRQKLIGIIKHSSNEVILDEIFKEYQNLTLELLEYSVSYNDLPTFQMIHKLFTNQNTHFDKLSLLSKSIFNDECDIFLFLIKEYKLEFTLSLWARIFSSLLARNQEKFLGEFFKVIKNENISKDVFEVLTNEKDIEVFKRFESIYNF